MGSLYRYFVEGQCEKKILREYMFLQEGPRFIDGKVEVMNFVNEKISPIFARTIKRDTTVVIVIDTDVNNIATFEENMKTLKRVAMLDDDHIWVVKSVKNFEDELVYSSDVSNVHRLFGTKGIAEFKTKFINHSDIKSKLADVGFSLNKLWTREGEPPFDRYPNCGHKIKLGLKRDDVEKSKRI